ncbi:uncharacterized protein LOC114882537 [Osmia bicornis bicornis]|uniref:uncharacterized protein LOC114882537 n=1 Tax=Osmia bicornis bicornis TaxID=1437191 RepID=UPI001EAEEE90|nr:uncharacterized protein LOC114882537 [Osmia bicornis bicornis]XP_046145203.1 uncharacterized protein LOC114882537 [Osmia bicornis bicornis]
MWKRKLQADRTWRTLLPLTSRPWASSNSAACARIETSSEVANSVPVFREEGFIEESSFLVDVTLCGNENCKQIEPGERYCSQPAWASSNSETLTEVTIPLGIPVPTCPRCLVSLARHSTTSTLEPCKRVSTRAGHCAGRACKCTLVCPTQHKSWHAGQINGLFGWKHFSVPHPHVTSGVDFTVGPAHPLAATSFSHSPETTLRAAAFPRARNAEATSDSSLTNCISSNPTVSEPATGVSPAQASTLSRHCEPGLESMSDRTVDGRGSEFMQVATGFRESVSALALTFPDVGSLTLCNQTKGLWSVSNVNCRP